MCPLARQYLAYGGKRGGDEFAFEPNYTGQRLDTTGLLYYGARDYDPQLGAFISADTLIPDPTHYADYNRYLYARGNPLKYNDPSGHYFKPGCPFCSVKWFDYSGTSGVVNWFFDSVATVGCQALVPCNANVQEDVVTGPTHAEYADYLANSAIGMGLTPMGTVRVPGPGMRSGAAVELIQDIISNADRWVSRKGVQGTAEAAEAAAARQQPILPGLFKYTEAPNIPGYERHHLWPEGLGGPHDGWSVYVQKTPENFHTANPYGIQSAVDHQLMEQTGLSLQQTRQWARSNPTELLPILREIYADMEIPFPY